ncbi:hypothetical protein AWB76_04965 [Caballeronia temeraria]|uniref:Uncharacterized protein n=1 Tax=Caballeronia temeraria TaxID=1777137 RepID=A0A158C0C9_9BURK|nr:hypothetical protein AWB76_04965 [Caballeronia temeraria]
MTLRATKRAGSCISSTRAISLTTSGTVAVPFGSKTDLAAARLREPKIAYASSLVFAGKGIARSASLVPTSNETELNWPLAYNLPGSSVTSLPSIIGPDDQVALAEDAEPRFNPFTTWSAVSARSWANALVSLPEIPMLCAKAVPSCSPDATFPDPVAVR